MLTTILTKAGDFYVFDPATLHEQENMLIGDAIKLQAVKNIRISRHTKTGETYERVAWQYPTTLSLQTALCRPDEKVWEAPATDFEQAVFTQLTQKTPLTKDQRAVLRSQYLRIVLPQAA
ncbi:hypothetical protein [Schleiferilactobacillus perolens]|jgi:hypothetical protein|uniref:Uncharacterized protein n=1 Tax=Schleiferilactobacillus perolens DSM 12744 TaxID=1423792 RepID=A0A0R1MHT4_9LACO|nr:hypothetical protein [Schleiferilactobacillus perolens]KRL07532.1 hypothetical protein FD09_GL002035 [Schleiferilactobacillus perolens DSM 12744]MCI1892565.1 hypothetical protein [Schleiferilactobacillus harbinensis]MCI1912900.1 hypothetical protein [Schleiferilactobacillus harbinensis]MCI2170584.1 hypothetical protein [Schleiferilactobacillus perolens]